MSDDLNADTVKAAIRQKRVDSGLTPATGTNLPSPDEPLPALSSSDEFSPEKVRAMLKQTRACAIKNAQSSEQLKEIQAATPGRGTQTSKFKTRGPSPASGVMRAPLGGAAQSPSSDAKQEKKSS